MQGKHEQHPAAPARCDLALPRMGVWAWLPLCDGRRGGTVVSHRHGWWGQIAVAAVLVGELLRWWVQRVAGGGWLNLQQPAARAPLPRRQPKQKAPAQPPARRVVQPSVEKQAVAEQAAPEPTVDSDAASPDTMQVDGEEESGLTRAEMQDLLGRAGTALRTQQGSVTLPERHQLLCLPVARHSP